MTTKNATTLISCFHCGESCVHERISIDEKIFCCEGCKLVYGILNEHSLCDYYSLNQRPGINQRMRVREDKFLFLEDQKVQARLISFQDENQVHISFNLPQIHCSSCLYLLEHLHRLDKGVISARVHFQRKEVDLVFSKKETSLRKVVELLTNIGYEPYISLVDLQDKKPAIRKSSVYQLGIAGFCFGNIMLMSFPEYLGIDASEQGLLSFFRWFNFILSLPVFFYAALPFYQSSVKSLRHRFLNIDAPIALAIIITFARSVYEIFTGSGSGYFDSMSGIVFFMLAGRMLQERTYRQLSFERDYTSYFPIAVSVLKDDKEVPVMLPDIKPGDTLIIHNEELIPADGILTRGHGFIDYSFVTGESVPVLKDIGELLYAGGKQTGQRLEVLVTREVSQSYLTRLWNKPDDNKQPADSKSFVHFISRYFTLALLLIGIVTAIYWQVYDPSRTWPAVTAVFIIACPCALLLSNVFTNGNILSILAKNGFYLRNPEWIEKLGKIDHIVFDKTGTLTVPDQRDISYEGKPLTNIQKKQLVSLVTSSAHPMGKVLVNYLSTTAGPPVSLFQEYLGKGIEGEIDGDFIRVGSPSFFGITGNEDKGTIIYIEINHQLHGKFRFENHYRLNLDQMLLQLSKKYELSVLTGDTDAERNNLRNLLGSSANLLFHQSQEDKLNYVRSLQSQGKRVMMIGDGLNDAAAFKQSDFGVALAGNANNFTPASDAIMDARRLPDLIKFIRLSRANKLIILISFVISVLYNIAGLSFAVQGRLSPMIAAILMPLSSLSIFIITFGSSSLIAMKLFNGSIRNSTDKDQVIN